MGTPPICRPYSLICRGISPAQGRDLFDGRRVGGKTIAAATAAKGAAAGGTIWTGTGFSLGLGLGLGVWGLLLPPPGMGCTATARIWN